jgi:LPXTG-site transpeptidase (sortase) family protein
MGDGASFRSSRISFESRGIGVTSGHWRRETDIIAAKKHQPRGRLALKRLETGLFLAGGLSLGVFFLLKAWSLAESRAGIEAFEEARDAVRSATPDLSTGDSPQFLDSDTVDPGVTVETPALEPTLTPDFTLWSRDRVAAYEAARHEPGAADAPLGVLRIEHLDIEVPVFDGAEEYNLNRGVARIIGTARVGETGNLGIAGHRDGFFRPLKDIELGDTFELETWHGTEQYRVASIDIVEPEEIGVLAPSEDATITLVTCYPFYFVGNAPQRFIVKGEKLDQPVRSWSGPTGP